jgi:hypothetical protein
MKRTDSEDFAKDYAYVLACELFPKDDPIFPAVLKQISASILGYRKLLLNK